MMYLGCQEEGILSLWLNDPMILGVFSIKVLGQIRGAQARSTCDLENRSLNHSHGGMRPPRATGGTGG